jgi:hypothetical protein
MFHGPEALMVTIMVVTIGLPLARGYARRIERRSTTALPPGMGEMMARMERMEQTMEAIATEVERISEAQRFTTKLLTAQSDTRPHIGAGSA